MLAQVSFAGDGNEIYLDDVIGPFPARGSTEEVRDFEVLLAKQNSRTKDECVEAERESTANLKNFFAGPKGPLTREEYLLANNKLNKLLAAAVAKIVLLKTKYNRPRPYISNREIKPCIDLENSKAYPSGHATLARAYARVLGIMFPSKQAALMVRADEVAANRVLGGVHHPSDIEAGKKLGDELADDYLRDGDHFYQIAIIH